MTPPLPHSYKILKIEKKFQKKNKKIFCIYNFAIFAKKTIKIKKI